MTEIAVRLREWHTLGPDDPQAALRGVRLDGSEARALARRRAQARVIDLVELYDSVRVRAMAHVGRIHLGGLTITIEPKIGSAQLLELFRYTYGRRNVQLLETAEFATTGVLLQDPVLSFLPRWVIWPATAWRCAM